MRRPPARRVRLQPVVFSRSMQITLVLPRQVASRPLNRMFGRLRPVGSQVQFQLQEALQSSLPWVLLYQPALRHQSLERRPLDVV